MSKTGFSNARRADPHATLDDVTSLQAPATNYEN